MRARLLVLLVLLVALVSGCSGSDSTTTAASTFSPASCPTENTRSFAKTRFVADVGGSVFLVNRYLVQPYRAGSFDDGADGRTRSFIKAGLAAAATVKLLDNATENAKANPTLCRAVAEPLSSLRTQVGGLVDKVKSGDVDPAALAGLGGLLGGLQGAAGKAGVDVPEKSVSLG